ncbi:unnamed protein product [Paramecium pentaurelia]|uniref:Uncharacterized protein n=1 Tax=Paramecium pentaurelia TaxID=43138 RepID=A0A8S1YIT7_9CILI|nr:unnamed protein product [Paramecium pentaurelia]
MKALHYKVHIDITIWIIDDWPNTQLFSQLLINGLSLGIFILIQDQIKINVVVLVKTIVLQNIKIFHDIHQIQQLLNYTQIIITITFEVLLILRLNQMNVIKDVNSVYIQQLTVSCRNCGNNFLNLDNSLEGWIKNKFQFFKYLINDVQLNMLVFNCTWIIEHGNQMIQKIQLNQNHIGQMAQYVSVNYQQFFEVQQIQYRVYQLQFGKQESCVEGLVMQTIQQLKLIVILITNILNLLKCESNYKIKLIINIILKLC